MNKSDNLCSDALRSLISSQKNILTAAFPYVFNAFQDLVIGTCFGRANRFNDGGINDRSPLIHTHYLIEISSLLGTYNLLTEVDEQHLDSGSLFHFNKTTHNLAFQVVRRPR